MTRPITLETDRLLLRQWKASDRAPLAAMHADPRVMEFLPGPLGRAASDLWAARCESLIAERGWGFWVVEEKSSGLFLGCVGLHVPTAELPFKPCVEVGWRLGFAHWGRGFATEAAESSLHFGFTRLNLSEIVAFTNVRNARSRAVMGRLGMVEAEGFEHPDLPVGHPLRPHVLYRLTRERWTGAPESR